jgi:outer membrane receptor protein involved in Fe transport
MILLGFFSTTQMVDLKANSSNNNSNEKNGKLTGTIIDETTKEPVSYATITIAEPGSTKPIDGTVTDDKGKFTINNIKPGNYDIIISFIGYEAKTISNVYLGDKNFELGTVTLNEGKKLLQEVTVQGQRDMFEEKVDRTVYNADQDESNKAGDATDVLRKVPMLSVDLDGNVTLRGSQNITVLINNRPSTITAGSIADALKQIPGEIIKSVEVITSPSARYDAEGSAGIINIVTKKNTLQGGTVNVNMGTGYRGTNLGLNGNYRTGKLGFNLGGFGRAGYNMPGGFENSQVSILENGDRNKIVQQADTRNNMLFGRYTLGMEYDINEKNFINGSIQYGARNFRNNQDGLLSSTFLNDALVRQNIRDVNTLNNSGTVDINLNYSHTFDRPQHELNVLTQYSRNNRTNNFFNDIYNGTDLNNLMSRLKNVNLSYNQETTVQIDYQNPITKNQMVETGLKQIVRQVTSDFETFTAVGNSDYQRVSGGKFSDVFFYDQNVSAAYLSYLLTTANKFSIKAGARYEYTTINAKFQNSEIPQEIPSYGALVPSINVSKNLKKGSVKVAYNRRLQRPSLQFLNPNIQNPNPAMVTIGNPYLDPEFTNNFELGLNTYFKVGFVNVTGYARNSNNSIQAVRRRLEDGIIETNYLNIGRESAYGTSIFGGLNKGKFSVNGGTDLYYADLDNQIEDPAQRAFNSGFVYSIRGSANYNITKQWGLQAFGFYRGNTVQLQGYQTGFYMYSLNLRKEFNEKRGSIGLGAENFLTKGMIIKNELSSPTFNQSSTSLVRNFNVRVNFSYRIGKMNANGNQRRKTKSISNDDMKSGGDGGGADMGGAEGGGGGSTGRAAGAMMGGNSAPPSKPAPVAKPNAEGDSLIHSGLTGRWQGSMGQFNLTIDLEEEGESELKGKYYSSMGEIAITDGIRNGKEFSFNILMRGNPVPYKGTLDGDKITLNANFMGRDIQTILERVK